MTTKRQIDIGEKYGEVFFSTLDRDAESSARIVLEILRSLLTISSVVDVGCGNGEWLRVWQELGVDDIVGIDGDFINRASLRIDSDHFVAHDLNQPLDLRRKFQLVQSLEVAEHLPEASAEVFLDTLVAHGDLILFSAAVPGQMGIQHVNEQPYEYWRDRFAQRGYALLDWIRPQLAERHQVAYWYRYNILLFARETSLERLPSNVVASRIPIDRPIPDVSPLAYRLRRAVTRLMPVAMVDWIVNRLHLREQRKLRRSH
ncbi:MAG: class I SAM-dependent methyltransferase [Planctomycetes bacterium]|nr:class I SAM-dependent methyltransferase [Planctomycetota bacterium]